ncbi:hypothetical protein GCM10027589_06200 [Actinocorallia lasiicapitis]
MSDQVREVEASCVTSRTWIPPRAEWVQYGRVTAAIVLGEECRGSDDVQTVLSELLGNAVRYGGDGMVYVELAHRGGVVTGMVLQIGADGAGAVEIPAVNLAELARLDADGLEDLSELLEGGRGLLVLDALAPGWQAVRLRIGLAVSWMITCGCGVG